MVKQHFIHKRNQTRYYFYPLAAEQENSVRWTIKPFHRERKQLTGVQTYQCRLGRSQRNHITFAERTCLFLNHFAYQTDQTVSQLRQCLCKAYLCCKMAQLTLTFA